MRVKVFDIVGAGLKGMEEFVSDPSIKVSHIRLSPATEEGMCDRFYVFYEPLLEDPTAVARQLEVEKEELRRLINLARTVRDGPGYEIYQKCKNQQQRQLYLLAHHGISSRDAAGVIQLLDPAMSSVLDLEAQHDGV